MKVLRTEEYEAWFLSLELRNRKQIDARIARIKQFEHFGDSKHLKGGMFELRWKNGHRVYFSRVALHTILLIFGGLKNAQKKDIKTAIRILERYADY